MEVLRNERVQNHNLCRTTPHKHIKLTKNRIILLLLILPLFAMVFIFSYVPLFGWVYAFVDYQPGIPIFKQQFVGLEFFKLLFTGGTDFFNALKNTLVLNFLSLITSPIPIAFAILISEVKSKRFAKGVQTITSLPNFLSWILVYSICFGLLSSDSGVFNKILMNLHLISQPTNILVNEGAAWYFQTILAIIKGTGWNAIVYLAAISGIDQELYNAADVDGAGRWAKIIHVTIPGVLPTFFIMLLLQVSSVLSAGFEQFYVFQNSMTVDKLEVLDTFVYKMGIRNNQYSYGVALGMFSSVVSIIILFATNHLAKKTIGNSLM